MSSKSLKALVLVVLALSACGKVSTSNDGSTVVTTPLSLTDADIYAANFSNLDGWDVLFKKNAAASPDGLILTSESEFQTSNSYCSSGFGSTLTRPLKQNSTSSATLEYTVNFVELPVVSDQEGLLFDMTYTFNGKSHILMMGKDSLLVLASVGEGQSYGNRPNPLDMSLGKHTFRFVFEDTKVTIFEDGKVLQNGEYTFKEAEKKDSLSISFVVVPKFSNVSEEECKKVKKGKVIIENLNISSKAVH